jgi:surface carbohydrate biosynthesis protein
MARILLLADHKWRDLPGLAYLQLVLERGFRHDVRAVTFHAARAAALTFRPDLVLFNTLYNSANAAFARELRHCGAAVAVLPNEGWAPYDGILDFFAGRYADLSAASVHFVWSNRVADRIRELGTLPPQNVHVLGMPRFDFYRSPLTALYRDRAAFCAALRIPPTQPIVTVATNFPTAKFAQANTAFLIDDWQRVGLAQVTRYADPIGYARMEVHARQVLLAALTRLADALPHVSIVVKPHPAEDVEIYRQFEAASGGRVTLVLNDYIWNLVNVSDVHLSRACTTGIEAWFLDKPTVETHLSPEDGWFFDDLAAGSDVATDTASLIAGVRRHLDGSQLTAAQLGARREYIARHFHRIDGERTIACATALDAAVAALPARPRYRYRVADAKPVVGRFVKQLLRVPPDRGITQWRTWYSKTDAIGQHDKTIRSTDVAEWRARLDPYVEPEARGGRVA